MAYNIGTNFEHVFKQDWLRVAPKSLCLKLPNQMSKFSGVDNLCDFICYDGKRMYLLECKSHRGASIPFDCISQYQRLVERTYIPNCVIGVVLWLYDKDKIYFIPIDTITEVKKSGKKSIGIKAAQQGYDIVEVPAVKKRVYMEADYTCILNYKPKQLENLENFEEQNGKNNNISE